MAQVSISDVQLVDDFYFSALSNENEHQIFPISDSKYAEELQLQEVIMSSLIDSQTPNTPPPPPPPTPPFTLIEASPSSNLEAGESSHCFCEICAEKKEADEMFRIDACSHSFCSICVAKHVAVKVQESAAVVACPSFDCGDVLEFDACMAKMPAEVSAAWADLLCESAIAEAEKFYCPFSDCSAMLVNDGGGDVITESDCPVCHRLFCARCSVPWHAGIECEEFQRLNEDERGREDLMVRELARSQSWMCYEKSK